MSHAAGNPVYCARKTDLGCTATHPGSKHDAIKAQQGGWFNSKKTGVSFCPAHVPDWVAAWRAKQAEERASA
jgi:hypothetical protein